MRKSPKFRISLLVTVLTLSLAASVLPAAAQSQPAQGTEAQQLPAAGVQVGENVLLRHDDPRPTRARDSVGVSVNPNDPNHIVMFNSDLYEFLCEYHTSRDGGATWTSGLLRAPEGFGAPGGDANAPCVSIGHGTRSYDGHHAIAFGSGNNVYISFSSARYGQEGEDNFELSSMVAHSTDGGETFATAVEAMTGALDMTNRHTGVVALPRDGQPDRLVVAAYDSLTPDEEDPEFTPETPGLVVAAASEDGGQTWSPREAVSDIIVGAQGGRGEMSLTQDDDGTVYVVHRGEGLEANLYVVRSEDGQTWDEPIIAGTVRGFDAEDFLEEGDDEELYPCCNYPRASAGSGGDVYITYMEGPQPPFVGDGDVQAQDHFIHPDANVWVVSSDDHGETWSDPVRVNDPVPGMALTGNLYENQVRHPDVTVAPNGRVDVVWQDRRHWFRGCRDTHVECNEARLGDTYWAHSTDGGQTFSQDVRVSDRTQNNEVGSDYRRGVWWDFAPQAVGMGNNALFVAWMDSRAGNHDNDALDIYYSRVDLNASPGAAIPQRWLPASDSGDLSSTLARHVWPGGSEATLTGTFATELWTRPVIVNEDDPAAALVGSVLARAYLGPVLASPAGGLTSRLTHEIQRMGSAGAFVLGDEAALSGEVVAGVQDAGNLAGDQVVRFGGSPAEMAAAVAHELDWRVGSGREDHDEEQFGSPDAPAFPAVVIVNPATPHGSAAAALAANRRMAVLFVEQDSVPAATEEALEDLNIDETLIIGDMASISDAVMGQMPNPTRLDGANVAETSVSVAQESLDRGLPPNVVYVSDSADPMDVALTGAAVGRNVGLHLAAASPQAATTALNDLGVAARVDRLVLTGGLETRVNLSWACPGGVVPAAGFVDIAGNTHENAIECAAWYGITEGGPGGLPANQYGPARSVRRDQMASFIARKIDASKPGLLPPAAGPNPFPGDLTEGNAHYDAIRRLAAAGVVLGLDGNNYGPARSVRRDQMASFIHRAIRFVAQLDETGLHRAETARIVTDEVFFTDASPTHLDNVNALASEGIVLGVGEGQYAGSRAVRRDQMASFVNRGLDFLVQHEQAQRPVLTSR